jgi:hypothetical protein
MVSKTSALDRLKKVVSKVVGDHLSETYFGQINSMTSYLVTSTDTEKDAIGTEEKRAGSGNSNTSIENQQKQNFNPKLLLDNNQVLTRLEKSILERLKHQEFRKQTNIENITCIAANELKEEPSSTDEPVDEDWTTRFFNIAEDVSNDEMQALWGKILAGEIKQPRSYSLRTLELLKSLSQDEANIFIRVANLFIESNNVKFIYKGADDLLKRFGVTYSDLSILMEIGLLQTGDLVNFKLYQSTTDSTQLYIAGNKLLIATKAANTPTIEIPIHVFSKPGNELLQLLTTSPPFEYLEAFAKFTKSMGLVIKHTNIVERLPSGQVRHTIPLQDFS